MADAGEGVRESERGDVAPLVILTPLTVFLVMFVIQLGLHFHARTVLNAAAQDGARAAQYENGTSADGMAAADQILDGSRSMLTVQNLSVDADPPTVTVTITAEIISVVPFWSAKATATASGPKEVFRPEDER
ncbi:MAG: pilus assembly protein TadE [Actinomycetia bacterium]|nr:pilus assembly protein TadE [Actinomycetes bacterium]MCP5033246.1 pilus assembly protein TadE [Actinomycetes bacterium]